MAARSFTGGRFALVIDGSENLGFVKSIEGGSLKGELATHNVGGTSVQKKRLATIVHEPFTIEVGMGMSAGFYDWIRASFDKGHITKTGEFIACDFDYKAMSAREFIDAHITEVTMPALDASSKEPAYMTVRLDPQKILYKVGDGAQVAGEAGRATKKWIASNFRFELGDLPCTRVSKVDSFTWKQGIIKDEVGAFDVPSKHPTRVEVPNIKISISSADIGPWQDWHRTFVIDGERSDSDELSGAITFLGPDLNEELASIDLLQVGILSLETPKWDANEEQVPRFTVELYVEKMRFRYLAGGA